MNGIQVFENTTKLVDLCLMDTGKDTVVHSGGTNSSKTYSILQALCILALSEPEQVITVVGQDIPNLKKGSYRDLIQIIRKSDVMMANLVKHNESERIFYFKNGSIIEFNSYQTSQDAQNGKRDYLFVNEANGISYEIFFELWQRTNKKTFIDFNPTARFWAHDKLKGLESVLWVNSTFRHNPFVKESVKKKILGYEPTPENIKRGTANAYKWQVHGLGKLGKLEGLVFPDYEIIYTFPEHHTDKRWFGLDFGFTNNPTALIEVVLYDGQLWLRQWIYETGLQNPDIYERMKALGFNFDHEVIADSAEPKSIAELQRLGVRVRPASKGADSVNFGIDIMKRYKINIHSRSKEMIEEFGSYLWAKDKNGNSTNTPIKKFNHGIDAVRYVALEHLSNDGEYWVL